MKIYKFKFANLFIHWKRWLLNIIVGVPLLLFFLFISAPKDALFYACFIIIMVCIFTLSDLTTVLSIDHEKIVYKTLFASKSKTLLFSEISHFCFYDIPVARGGSADQLEAFLKKKPREEHKRKHVRLNFTAYEIDEILSHLHRHGFKVLLFEPLKNIEETERYIEE